MIIYTLFILFLISLNFDKIILFNGTDLTGWKIYGTEKYYRGTIIFIVKPFARKEDSRYNW